MVSKIFGDDQKRLSDTDILPVALGIIIGVLVGNNRAAYGVFFIQSRINRRSINCCAWF